MPAIGSNSRKNNPNYLRADLLLKAMSARLKFSVNVQLDQDNETTPIEDAFEEWTEENSPSIRVGTLTFEQQDFTVRDEMCENLRFSPGNFHPDHRPVGNMGRGRIFTYRASQVGRLNTDEPVITSSDL